ncbi:flavin-containing monooxygenase [Microtetraspora niveoalba]|uniref:flavin-containing monooxygenase n=1 Tax=Microtetraspora niveoalba TaxID=46175 RepID=UPI000834DF71|nr:NAD(P)/FAD-dependent oxidoreductase [Microtetraspora niveoalba]
MKNGTTVVPSGTYDVLVVGAGFAGLYAVHRALGAGFRAIGVEAAPGVGGTWYWNRYPGARCDVESIDYSYSFDEELQDSWVWSERYATQPEILAYLEHVADRFGLRPHFRFDRRVESARFDEGDATWTVTTDAGEAYRARFVVLATGSLSAPNKPPIPGADRFAGEVLFTAQWPREKVSFAGKRVGIIGTGSSGIQSIPIIAEEAASLTVFQRSPNYSVPAFNRPLTEDEQVRVRAEYPERRRRSAYSGAGTPHETYPKTVFEIDEAERLAAFEARWKEGGVLFGKTFPDQTVDEAVNKMARDFAEAKIRAIVADQRTADDLIPVDHPIGTKRICTDSGYYATFNRENVTLVNLRREPIVSITERGIETGGSSYELDTLIYATGFDAMTGAVTRIDIRGARGARIGDAWGEGPVTYLGMAIPGFPNLFTVNGPGSPSVLANMVLTAEQQVDWVVDLLADCRSRGVTEVEARADSAAKWTGHVDEVAHRTLFPKADSWYVGANIEGKRRVFMPYIGGFGAYRRTCEQVRAGGYEGFVLTARSGEGASR